MQHLPGYVPSFRQINHSIGDILRFGDRAHRRKGHQEVFWDRFDNRGVENPRRNRVEADVVLRILARKVTVIASSPPLVSIEIEAGRPAMGFWASEDVRLVTLPPAPCDSICATASWVTKKKPSRLVETRLRKSWAV